MELICRSLKWIEKPAEIQSCSILCGLIWIRVSNLRKDDLRVVNLTEIQSCSIVCGLNLNRVCNLRNDDIRVVNLTELQSCSIVCGLIWIRVWNLSMIISG